MKIAPIEYGDRKVYSVAGFNRGVADWLARLPTLWVEGEVTELRRHAGWQSVFFTLKDPSDGACLPVTMPRGRFEALRLDLADGERVHVFGRPELYEARGDFRLRALTIERFGLGGHLAALERLKRKLAAEGLFAPERKRPLPRLPRAVGLVTGNDAAAKRDVVSTLTARFPPAHVIVAETYVQGPRAAAAIVDALHALAALSEVEVIVVARGGGSFEDLLPFSDERLDRNRGRLARAAQRTIGRERDRLALLHDRLGRAPSLALERKRAALEQSAGRLSALSPKATLTRGYAIVRTETGVVRSPAAVQPGQPLRVEVAEGEFGARVE